MVSVWTITHTIFSRFLLFFLMIISLPVVIVMMLLPARIRYASRWIFWAVDLFYWTVIKISFIPVMYRFQGDDVSDGISRVFTALASLENGPVIFVANHQSSLDIPLVGVLARRRSHIWIARRELMRWKLLRWVLPRLSVIIDTASREKTVRSMLSLIRLVEGKDIDIMMFPEGGRFSDNEVHPFYGGFVMLAKMLKRPVVPVYIQGANKVYPPHTFWIKQYPIKVNVGKPFVMQDNEDEDLFKQRVHQWFIDQAKR